MGENRVRHVSFPSTDREDFTFPRAVDYVELTSLVTWEPERVTTSGNTSSYCTDSEERTWGKSSSSGMWSRRVKSELTSSSLPEVLEPTPLPKNLCCVHGCLFSHLTCSTFNF